MNNTNTKQIIAGLPDESWVTFYNTVMDTHIDAAELKALAAAVPEWVSVKDALPPDDGDYLVSARWDDEGDDLHTTTISFHTDINDWYDAECERSLSTREIIAWMPLPEPFNQEDKDDIEEKIRKVTERGDAITGDEFEGQRR